MNEAGLTTWVWWIAGGLFGVGGLLLAYWSLFYNRSRGKRRCPKCWYDMSYTEGNTCSECGKSQKREKRFFKTKRRWRCVIVSILLVIGGWTMGRWPWISDDGWNKLVPTTGLLVVLPWLDSRYGSTLSATGGNIIKTTPVKENLITNIRHELRLLLLDRLKDKDIYDWQWDWVIERCLSGDRHNKLHTLEWKEKYGVILGIADDMGVLQDERYLLRAREAMFAFAIKSRNSWPVGVPFHSSVVILSAIKSEFKIFGEYDYTITIATRFEDAAIYSATVKTRSTYGNRIRNVVNGSKSLFLTGTPATISDFIQFNVAVDYEYPDYSILKKKDEGGSLSFSFSKPINIVNSIDSILTPVVSEEVEKILQDDVFAFWKKNHSYITLYFGSKALKELYDFGDVTLALRIQLMQNNKVLAEDTLWTNGEQLTINYDDNNLLPSSSSYFNILQNLKIVPVTLAEGTDGYYLRLTSAPNVALWNYDCDLYWKGEVTIPVKIVD